MKKIVLVFLLLIALGATGLSKTANGQQVRMKIEGDYEKMFQLFLPDMIVMIADNADSGAVEVVRQMKFGGGSPSMMNMPSSDLDLKQGDVVMMVDGEPLASTADLKKIYADAEVGQEISLGISREDEALVTSFAKPDPSTLPKMRVMKRGEGQVKDGDDAQKPPR